MEKGVVLKKLLLFYFYQFIQFIIKNKFSSVYGTYRLGFAKQLKDLFFKLITY